MLRSGQMERRLALSLALVMIAVLAMPQLAEATITGAQIVNTTGVVVNLNHDNQTQSYADGSVENPNINIKICSTDTGTDLLNKFAGLFYRVGSVKQEIHVLPAQMIASTISGGCATIDIDLSLFTARYPGVPVVAVDSSSSFSAPTFVSLSSNTSDGFLDGNYTVDFTEITSTILNTTVTFAYDEDDDPIPTNQPFIILGLITESGGLEDVKQVRLNESVNMSWSGDGNFNFSVNGIILPRTMCGNGQTMCDDGVCRTTGTCPPKECNDGPNGICEVGEGCGCPDCFAEISICGIGLQCLTTQGCGQSAITGAVFGGPRAPFECIWRNTYDRTALPDNPVRLFFFHECTALREVSFNVKGPFTGARIATFGNDTIPSIIPSGEVFGYFRFEHNIPIELFDGVLMQFRVNKAQLLATGLDVQDVSLQRQDNGVWNKIETIFTAEDNEFFYFEAETESLSLFAVVASRLVPVGVPPTPIPAPTPPIVPVAAIPTEIIALGILGVLLVIILAYGLTRPRIPKIPKPPPEVRMPKQPPARFKPERVEIPRIVTPARIEGPPKELADMRERLAKVKQELAKERKVPQKKVKIIEEKSAPKKLPKPKALKKAETKRIKRVSKQALEELERELGKK